MIVLNVLSWLPAKEISIKELEQIFIKHLNGTYNLNSAKNYNEANDFRLNLP